MNDKIPLPGRNRRVFPAVVLLLILSAFLLQFPREGTAQRTKTSQRAGEQVKAEKGLRDNRYFFYFINSSITNLGTAEEKKLYKESIQRDILSQLIYMKFLFKESYSQIRKAQKTLITLYQITLKRDIGMTKNLLDELAPRVVESKDRKALLYLRLGYRDMSVAQQYLLMADNFTETLYSMRLYKYGKAIKNAKHGKRYALLAMAQALLPAEEKRELERISYDDMMKKIEKVSPPDRKDFYRTVHMDDYYRSRDEKSFYDVIWENPELHQLEDFQKYFKDAD